MPVSVANFLRSGRLPRDGSKASRCHRAHSAATSLPAWSAWKALGGLTTFMVRSLGLQSELFDHRTPTLDLALDECGQFFRRRSRKIDRGNALAKIERQDAPHFGIELGNNRLR